MCGIAHGIFIIFETIPMATVALKQNLGYESTELVEEKTH